MAARLPDRAVWIDGRVLRGAEAALSVFDRGARDGEGLFETLRVYGGHPFLWDRHMERLVLSAAELGFPVPPSPARMREGVDAVLEANGLSDAVIRITVTRGVPGGRPTRTGCWIDAEPIEARLWAGTRKGGARVIVSKRAFEPGPLAAHKTTSRLAYHLAREEARAHRADEAILESRWPRFLEGAASNLFVVIGGALLTPPVAHGLLPGITRSYVLELARTLGIEASEGLVGRGHVAMASEAFLTSAVQEIVSIVQFENVPVGEVGRPVVGRLQAAYREAVERSAREAGARRS